MSMLQNSRTSFTVASLFPTPWVTLTGADDSVSQEALWLTTEEAVSSSAFYSPGRVEWGILYSEVRAGTARYPSLRWIQHLIHHMEAAPAHGSQNPLFSLHLCGDAVLRLLEGDEQMHMLIQHFDRIQLNARASKLAPHREALLRCLRQNSCKAFITQHNTANLHLYEWLASESNHHLLMDASRGRGKLPSAWTAPPRPMPCGYSGGLGIHNISSEIPLIAVAVEPHDFWVDMESSLRTPIDQFDLNRAKACIEVVLRFDKDRQIGWHQLPLPAD